MSEEAAQLAYPREGFLFIGLARLTLLLPGNHSLKGKRQISRALTERLRARFHVAVAEVDSNDIHQRLVIGIGYVSNRYGHASEVIDAALRFIESSHFDIQLIDISREVIDGP